MGGGRWWRRVEARRWFESPEDVEAPVETSRSCVVVDPEEEVRRFGKSYLHGYSAPLVKTSAVERDQETLFQATDDLLDFEAAADAMSVTLHKTTFCGVGGVFGDRGSGRSAFLGLLWQSLQRRQAQDHAREMTRYAGRSCLAFLRWRYCRPSLVDYGGPGTLAGYYLLCDMDCADLVASDTIWGTILDAMWLAIAKEYGTWALPYLARVGPKRFPRNGPVFLKLVVITALKICLVVLILVLIASAIRHRKLNTRRRAINFVKVTGRLYAKSLQVATAGLVVLSALSYLIVACRQQQRKRRLKDEARAAEEEKWRSEKGGFSHKVFKELKLIAAMLEVHVRHRRAWPMWLRLCLPDLVDGLLCDVFFRCYAWPQIVIKIDDLDKVPSKVAVDMIQALTALTHIRGPVRHASPFKIIFAADPAILNRALGNYFEVKEDQPTIEQVADGEDLLRSFVTVPFHLPEASPERKFELAKRILSSVGVRPVGFPELSAAKKKKKNHHVGVLIPEDPKPIVEALHRGRLVRAATPKHARPGHVAIAACGRGRQRHQVNMDDVKKVVSIRDCDPQFMTRKEYRKSLDTTLGGEFLPGDYLVFGGDDLARCLPANPRRMWRVVATFHIAQKLARHRRLPDATDVAWRRRLLRYVLAAERFPFRFACLRHVTRRRNAAFRTVGPLRQITLDTPATDVYASLVDLLVCKSPTLRPFLKLDDGAPQDLLKLLDTLQVHHLLHYDQLARHHSSAIAQAIAQAQPDDLLLSTLAHASSSSSSSERKVPDHDDDDDDARTVAFFDRPVSIRSDDDDDDDAASRDPPPLETPFPTKNQLALCLSPRSPRPASP